MSEAGPVEQPLARTGDTEVEQAAAPSGLAALDDSVVEQVVVGGDLARLTPAQRVAYYRAVCNSLGLNPLTQPFEYIRLQDRLRLYAKREATDQLRKLHGVSVQIVAREQQGDLYVVTARATTPDGRVDESTGAVCIAGLSGASLGNALMRGETKAKRRVTLSICGLGWLDESEVDSVPVARPVKVTEAGEILDAGAGRDADGGGRGGEAAAPEAAHGSAARDKLLRRWAAVCDEADALGVRYEPLAASAGEEEIIRRGRALKEQIAAAAGVERRPPRAGRQRAA